ncbi:MAG: hypothetical protein HYW52_05485 [Gemmatimonadetes bacterium]|nr:hypothetical protein [Gemmatimonadota bacterium]
MTDGASRDIRFLRAQIDPLPDDRCQALVQVERVGLGPTTGTAQGGGGQADALRAVARAAADALSEAYDAEGVKVRVRGVQQVEAFGQIVIIVSLAATRGAETRSLLGGSRRAR